MISNPNLSPLEQLQALEDAYAQLLMDDMDAATLSQLWNNIKALRKQLNAPIYENGTSPETEK